MPGLAKGGREEALVHRGGGKSLIAEHECLRGTEDHCQALCLSPIGRAFDKTLG